MTESAGGVLQRADLIGMNSYWRQKKFAYDTSSNLEYIGFHFDPAATTADTNWAVWKFSYTGSDLTSIEGPLTGDWDNRATHAWS